MKIDRRTRYALRMMIDLAEHSDGGRPVGVRSIAKRQDITRRYLEQIATSLRRAGLVTSKKGQTGGYLLARPASEIGVGEIVEAVSGPVLLLNCLAEPTTCARVATCRSRRMWALIDTLVRSVLSQYHLDDLVENRLPLPPDPPLDMAPQGCSPKAAVEGK
jgi:Rrf2 family protein